MKTKPSISSINYQASQFLRVKNAFELSKLLNHDIDDFINTVKHASYREFSIPKSKGGKRMIEAPDEGLLLIQKRLNVYLQAVYYKIKPDVVYGFVNSLKDETRQHTIITNANNHVGKRHVLNIDLKDFFHSISATKVKTIFQNAPFCFSEDVATCLALICCWKKRLPMGAATSPAVSNLFCIHLDKKLIELAHTYNFNYTRYADDLTFSTDAIISEDSIAAIKKNISENGFIINERKLRLQSKFSQQTVTGIKVNQKLNVDRRYIRNIRAALHDIKLNGLEKAALKHFKTNEIDEKFKNTLLLSLTGKINFIGQVRGKSDIVYNALRQNLNQINNQFN